MYYKYKEGVLWRRDISRRVGKVKDISGWMRDVGQAIKVRKGQIISFTI